MKYRPEIDGLRAVAVLPVILFHAGIAGFSGGYVGVDVFFVISGYLITSLLAQDMAQGRFSLLRFYERRARRLLPALFTMMAACLPFAWMWMMPSQFESFAASLLSVAVFGANILFWREDDYFAATAEEKPLLHTWSLAVEEQFYIGFPLLLLLLWSRGRHQILWVFYGLAIASLALAELGLRLPRVSDAAVFYLLPTRAWELLAGALCAMGTAPRATWRDGPLALLGLAMIGAAMTLFDQTTPFPSVWAVIPVAGSVLVIRHTRPGTWAGAILASRPFVGIGLISYSAYLWHQPLFAFARIRSLHAPSGLVMAALAVGALLLAWLTWRYVEQPFRRGPTPWLARRGRLFAASGAGLAVFIALGAWGWAGQGLPGRLPPDALKWAAAELDRNPYLRHCNLSAYKTPPAHPVPACSDFLIDGKAQVAIIGDSHSHAIAYETQRLLAAAGIGSYALSYGGCPALPGFRRTDMRDTQNCSAYVDSMLDYMRRENISVAVLAARFTQELEGTGFNNGEGGVEEGSGTAIDLLDPPKDADPEDDEARRVRVLAAFGTGLRALADDVEIVLVHPIPEAGWNVPQTLLHRALHGGDGLPEPLSTDMARFTERNAAINTLFNHLDHPRIHHVRPAKTLCDRFVPGRCVNEWQGKAFYFDDDHLSNAGAQLIAPDILQAVQTALGSR